jgi:perosamine synthetase
MIPVNEPLLNGRELEYVTECVKTGWVSSAGRFIEEFEKQWAAYCDRQHGIAVCNGTVALQAAVAALDLRPGDEVIMPTFTIISCALAVVEAGGKPVLVDSDPQTWNMDTTQIAAKITERTRAIMPVHIYSAPVDMDPVLELARQHRLAVIEDAAEAHGAKYKGRRCGGFGTMSTFSFYANKLITTGEGGMVLTDDTKLANRLASLRNLCFQAPRRFYHEELGFNFRMTNLQAALGLAQLERMDQIIAQKRWIGAEYTRHLAEIPEIELQLVQPWAQSVYWMFGLVVKESTGLDAVKLAKRLEQLGVQTRPFFLGMHEQPVFHRRGWYLGEHYPVAERIASQGLYLPSGTALTPEQLITVVTALKQALAER